MKVMPMTDITEHKWSDKTVDVDSEYILNRGLHLYCGQAGEIFINKSDAIAIAKHFDIFRALSSLEYMAKELEVNLDSNRIDREEESLSSPDDTMMRNVQFTRGQMKAWIAVLRGNDNV